MLIDIALKLTHCAHQLGGNLLREAACASGTLRPDKESRPFRVVHPGIPCRTNEAEPMTIGTKPLVAAGYNRVIKSTVCAKRNPGIGIDGRQRTIARQLRQFNEGS